MKVFIDCEFDGFAGALLSMAVVCEDGREWYGVLPTPVGSEWVLQNVVPLVYKLQPTIEASNRNEFNSSLHRFLKGIDNPHIVADWYTDLVHFFQSYEGPDHMSSFPRGCSAELRPELNGNAQSDIPHNALSDARGLRAAYMQAKAA